MFDVIVLLVDVMYIVIDEVYEWSLDMDFFLNFLCEVMKIWKDMLKLVFMFVMFDVVIFKSYFIFEGLSVGFVEIFGRIFFVEEFYFDDVVCMIGFGVF